jgi:N-succinyldiaminopimelate aminotransferase
LKKNLIYCVEVMVSDPLLHANPGLSPLQPYPFQRLKALLADIEPANERTRISLSIGEPQHAAPALVAEALRDHLSNGLQRYPATNGEPELREAIATWLTRRFNLAAGSVDPDHHVLPAAGTREALFAVTQALLDPSQRPAVLMPNPFYQIYEGAALLAGGEPVLLNTTAANDYIPDLDVVSDQTWARCGLIYLCSPGNPSGQILPQAFWNRLLSLRERFGFVICADECYSELYRNEQAPPLGLLEACSQAGDADFTGCLIFHSLSKRSNLPGLRSGFIAGDASLIKAFAAYRTYQGCAMPLHHQYASHSAWLDETHVIANRDAYREKFALASQALQSCIPYREPEAGFYLWLGVPGGDDEAFTRALYAAEGVRVLPGRYLSRPTPDGDPGCGYVRLALVAEPRICEDALMRIQQFIQQSQ